MEVGGDGDDLSSSSSSPSDIVNCSLTDSYYSSRTMPHPLTSVHEARQRGTALKPKEGVARKQSVRKKDDGGKEG